MALKILNENGEFLAKNGEMIYFLSQHLSQHSGPELSLLS